MFLPEYSLQKVLELYLHCICIVLCLFIAPSLIPIKIFLCMCSPFTFRFCLSLLRKAKSLLKNVDRKHCKCQEINFPGGKLMH